MTVIYSALKIFRFPEQLRSIDEKVVGAPIHIRVKPINACNHKCWFCAYRADNLELGSSMRVADRIPELKMYELIQDFSTMGVRAVTFSGGGEPLLYPGIDKVITKLDQEGIKVGCLTNGALLKGTVADAVANHCTWIRVSIDGWDGESYAKSRGVKKDEFEKVLFNIQAFNEKKARCVLGISFIVTEANASHIFEFAKRAKEIGVRTIKISGCVVSNNGHENAAYHTGIFSKVRDQIEMCQSISSERFEILDHYHEQMKSFDKPYRSCPSLSLLTVIGADCNVYSCQDKAYTDSGYLGSIKNMSFREFWNSKDAIEARSRISPQNSCQHHCVAHRKNMLLTEVLEIDPDHAPFI